MTTPTPGWYADPEVPGQMRWWDGSTWTGDVYERVEPPGGYLSETPADQPAGQAQLAATTTATRTPGAVPSAGPVTEDGVPLATWGRRVGARVVDTLITTPIGLLLSLPVLLDVVRHLVDVARSQQGDPTPDLFAAYDAQTLRSLAVVTLVTLLVGLVYEMVFLLWKAATPGKLALGLRVRRVQPGEPLRAGVVARRWIGYQALAQVPSVGPVYALVDVLWPLWDPRRQALHDKLAGTVVVMPPRDAR